MSGDSSVLGRQHLTACSILLCWGLCPKLKHCPDTEVATACSSQRGVKNELCCARRSASNAGNPISRYERTSACACFSPRDCKLPDRWAKKLSEPVAGRKSLFQQRSWPRRTRWAGARARGRCQRGFELPAVRSCHAAKQRAWTSSVAPGKMKLRVQRSNALHFAQFRQGQHGSEPRRQHPRAASLPAPAE